MSFALKHLSPTRTAKRHSRLQCLIMMATLFAAANPARSDTTPPSAPMAAVIFETGLAAVLLAQAGNVGGSVAPPAAVGRVDKSVSGGEPAVQAPPLETKKPQQAAKRNREPRPSERRPEAPRCSWAVGQTPESAQSLCLKSIGGGTSNKVVGGCDDEGQWGGLAAGVSQNGEWVAVGSNIKNMLSVNQSASRALSGCNEAAEAKGFSCKMVRTWGSGCNYVASCCRKLQ